MSRKPVAAQGFPVFYKLHKSCINLQKNAKNHRGSVCYTVGVGNKKPGGRKERSGMQKTFEMVLLSELKPYGNNPRDNRDAVEKTEESIRQTAYITPIIIDEDSVILAGHTRLKALMNLNITEAEVLRVTGLTEEEKRKFRLLDNRTGDYARWDAGKLVKELEEIRFGDADFGWEELIRDLEHPDMDMEEKEGKGLDGGGKLLLRFGSFSIPLTEQEAALLQEKLEAYTDAYGYVPGFVNWLLDGAER